MSNGTVFVTSATGTLGSALTYQLIINNYTVHFTTRSPTSAAALALIDLGAIMFPSSPSGWDDIPTLTTALQSCTHLFLNTFPSFDDPSHEITQVKTILRLSQVAGVKQVVYSSALPTYDLPQFNPSHWSAPLRLAKKQIELIVRQSEFQYWSIVRPGYFMANFLNPKVEFQYPGATKTGEFLHGFTKGKEEVVPLVDEKDVAIFVLSAFMGPEVAHGRIIAIASESLKVGDVVEILRRVTGREIRGRYLSAEEIEREEGSVRMALENQRSFEGLDGLVDWKRLKEGSGVELGTFKEYLGREREKVEGTYKEVKRVVT
ncbi:hypothetical protein B0T14DRAFT_569129 [Immersiella caudata]|uniref:NmrA-like domain-containing protein n=1 Tax=Immersiella caudata TaxID=314043 RepID=A0AA39WLR9_9PEZI|nr:hypothetical protein B0T14DRAFT_569129 [Immersiella caudata]